MFGNSIDRKFTIGVEFFVGLIFVLSDQPRTEHSKNFTPMKFSTIQYILAYCFVTMGPGHYSALMDAAQGCRQ